MTWRPISPDGKTVVWFYGQFLLYPTDGGEPRPIPGLARGELVVGWTSDGRALYVRDTKQMPIRIFRLDVSTGQRQLWKETGASQPWAQLVMTPDGKSYSYGFDTNSSDLYLVDGLR